MVNSKSTKTMILVTTALALFAATATTASADTHWQKHHPRREQVNHRLARQNHRILQEVREGDLSHRQAANLHRKDHQIRREERAMAAHNGGHITPGEQKALNQQENGVSRQIGR